MQTMIGVCSVKCPSSHPPGRAPEAPERLSWGAGLGCCLPGGWKHPSGRRSWIQRRPVVAAGR